jgi:hypothetical protein
MKKSLLAFFCLMQIGFFAQNGFTTYTANPAVNLPVIITRALLVDNNGNKWVGLNTSGSANVGLARYDNSTWTIYSTSSVPALPSNSVTALAKGSGGTVWIGTNAGLVRYTGTTFITYNTSDGLPSNTITCIETIGSSVYVGTTAGLSRYDGLNFTNYTLANGKLPDDNITSLKAENANLVWIGGVDKLVKFSINSSFTTSSYINTPLSPSPGKINCIYIDQQNTKWLGTTTKGVLIESGNGFVNASDTYTVFGSVIPTTVNDIAQGYHNGVLIRMNKSTGKSIGVMELAPGKKVYQYFYPLANKVSDQLEREGTKLFISSVLSNNNLMLYAFDENMYTMQLGEVSVDNFKTLEINQVRAGIANRGDMHWDIGADEIGSIGGNPIYEVPKGSGKHSNFVTSLWIGGLDNANQLHGAAQTYRQQGNDFWPGPLDTVSAGTNNAVAQNYDKIWKVSYTDINAFITNFNNGHVQNGTYTVNEDILTWPAKGTGNYSRNLAPFKDINNNGIYDPLTGGDYPLIKGDQALYYIFNDNLAAHGSSCTPMGVEVHAMAYAYGCSNILSENPVLDYTTFYNYKIVNRSANAYHDVTIGLFSDMDLGNYTDDYIGCNVTGNYGYGYNADGNDQNVGGTNFYGNYIPAQGFAVVKGPLATTADGIDNDNDGIVDETGEECRLSRFVYHRSGFPAVAAQQGEPVNCTDFYGYMNGQWLDGTPFTCGGLGYGGSTATHWIFSGDPNHTGVDTDPSNTCGYWTEASAGNTPSDRRLILSTGPFNLGAGQTTEIEYAFVTSFDSTSSTNSNLRSVEKLQTDVQNVNQYYNLANKPACTDNPVSIKNRFKEDHFTVYPNPANSFITVHSTADNLKTTYEMMDVLGKLIFKTESSVNDVVIPVSDLKPGIYFLRLRANGETTVRKIIKE